MTVKELRERLAKVPDDQEVVIETEHGQRYEVLTAKSRTKNTGRTGGYYFWIATGKKKT